MKKVIAIDIGGTKIHGAIVDAKGVIHGDEKVETLAEEGAEKIIERVLYVIDSLITQDISAIGIASAGRINTNLGEVYYGTSNLPGWTGLKIKEKIEAIFGIPVFVDNDVKAAGLGEEWLGSARGAHSYVCLTLGTGVGGALKLDGCFIRGKHWSAGELGHVTLYPGGLQCNCGLKGCAEQYLSGSALVKEFNRRSEKQITDGYGFFDLVKRKDKIAISILEEFTDNLSTFLVSLANTYDPEIFVIGGGLIDTQEYWWNSLLEKISKSPICNLFVPKVVMAKNGNMAGILGAAKLALQK